MQSYRNSQRESIFNDLTGEDTSKNFPGKPEHITLSEDNPEVNNMISLAKSFKLVESTSDIQQLLRKEETHIEQVRRQEVLFQEGVDRMLSFVVSTLEDDAFKAKFERDMGLKKGSTDAFLEKYKIMEQLADISDISSVDKDSTAYKLNRLVTTIVGMDRISRSSSQWGLSDSVLAKKLGSGESFNIRDHFEVPFSNYRRESQGIWGTLLSLKYREQIMDKVINTLDPENSEFEFMLRERLDAVAGTSGMAVLKTLVEMVPEDSPIYYSDTSYFEILPEDSLKILSQDQILGKIKEENIDTLVPITVVLQPYSSSPGEESNSLSSFLSDLENIDGELKRPINIIVDATMIPVPVGSYETLINSQKLKDVKLTSVWSLIKHGQMGLDMTMGGVAMTYGDESRALREELFKNNGFIPEDYAARLVPHSADTMRERMKQAGENTEVFYNYLKQLKTPYGLFEAPSKSVSLAKEYGTDPCLVFLPLHNSLAGLHFPESFLDKTENLAEGTSYGFDRTRIELIPDIKGTGYLRIAAGQEGPLTIVNTLNELTEYLKWSEIKVLEDIRFKISDLEFKATTPLDDPEMQIRGYTEDDAQEAKVLLLSMMEAFSNLPEEAKEYLRKSDYYDYLKDAEKFVSDITDEEILELTSLLMTPLLKLDNTELDKSGVKLEIEKKYPGLSNIVKDFPVNIEGKVDGTKITEYLNRAAETRSGSVVLLFEFMNDMPLRHVDGSASKIPTIIMQKLRESAGVSSEEQS